MSVGMRMKRFGNRLYLWDRDTYLHAKHTDTQKARSEKSISSSVQSISNSDQPAWVSVFVSVIILFAVSEYCDDGYSNNSFSSLLRNNLVVDETGSTSRQRVL